MSCAKYRVNPLVKYIYSANSIYIYVAYITGVPDSYVYIYRVYPVLTVHRDSLLLYGRAILLYRYEAGRAKKQPLLYGRAIIMAFAIPI